MRLWERLALALLALAWPLFGLTYALDVCFVMWAGSTRWGLFSTMATGGEPPWTLPLLLAGLVVGVGVAIAIARRNAWGWRGALVLCGSALVLWGAATLAALWMPFLDPATPIVGLATYGWAVWALRRPGARASFST